MKHILMATIVTGLLADPAHALEPALDAYAAQVIGSFTSLEQSRGSDEHSEVEAEIVRIWPERTDGVWLYQEQAIMDMPQLGKARPYFQRIGHVYRDADGRFRRDNYELTDPKAFIGAYADPSRFAALSPDQLGEQGCHNILTPIATGYWLSSVENCANDHRGAAQMFSIGIAEPDGFANWDRGVATDGSHVWGPPSGGYIFRRKN